MADSDTGKWAAEIRAGDRGAVARALNAIDDRRREAEALALLEALESGDSGAARVGVTGAPGAGKSTLLDAVTRHLRESDERVGIVAVDPSSRRSGGALLGDRVRMRAGARDPGVFVRSMAARERLGGLADATYAGVAVLAAAFDWVFVETVGVGQSESEVAPLVDTLLFVAQPGAGDLLQFMKAGILEWPDVFAVNKADTGPAAERSAAELRAGVSLGEAHGNDWEPPVLLCSARDGAGISELVETLRAHRKSLDTAGRLAARRAEGRAAFATEALGRRYGEYGLAKLGGASAVADRVRRSDAPVFRQLSEIGRKIEAALRS